MAGNGGATGWGGFSAVTPRGSGGCSGEVESTKEYVSGDGVAEDITGDWDGAAGAGGTASAKYAGGEGGSGGAEANTGNRGNDADGTVDAGISGSSGGAAGGDAAVSAAAVGGEAGSAARIAGGGVAGGGGADASCCLSSVPRAIRCCLTSFPVNCMSKSPGKAWMISFNRK
ncbi:MAG: hypothetical protein WCB12_20495 [Bryobacteraceae bacterium]